MKGETFHLPGGDRDGAASAWRAAARDNLDAADRMSATVATGDSWVHAAHAIELRIAFAQVCATLALSLSTERST